MQPVSSALLLNDEWCEWLKRGSAVIYRFGEHGKRVDGWKSAIFCCTRIRIVPSTRGGGRRGESRELLWVGAGESSVSATDINNTSSATRSTTKWTIEKIWGSKATYHGSQCHIKHPQEKSPSKFAIFHVKPIDFRFVTLFMSFPKFGLPRLVWSFPNKKWVILSHFSLLSKRNIKTLNSCFLGKHVKETMC